MPKRGYVIASGTNKARIPDVCHLPVIDICHALRRAPSVSSLQRASNLLMYGVQLTQSCSLRLITSLHGTSTPAR